MTEQKFKITDRIAISEQEKNTHIYIYIYISKVTTANLQRLGEVL